MRSRGEAEAQSLELLNSSVPNKPEVSGRVGNNRNLKIGVPQVYGNEEVSWSHRLSYLEVSI